MSTAILVSGASGIVGYGILKSLADMNADLILVGTTVHDHSVAPAFSHVFEKAPYTNDSHYFDWLATVIQRHNIRLLIPSIESDVFAWNENREFFTKLGVTVVLNTPKLIELCHDKWLFYQELKKNNSPYAIATSLTFDQDTHVFPLLLKPRRGYGSRGIHIVTSHEELMSHASQLGESVMIQPLIGCAEEEYTCSAFFTHESELCAHMTLQRTLSKQGFTETAATVDLGNCVDALQHLAAIFKPVGPTNFQFRKDGSQLKLLEINPRISSATSIRTAFGYNESKMAVEYMLYGKMPTQPMLKLGYAVRYTEDKIFYDSANS